MYLQTLVILLSIENTFSDFLPVLDDCKYWDYLKVYGNGEVKKVHCILDQNFQSGLVYTEWKMISNGTCPIYNRFARQIDSIPCNRKIGMCPNDAFPSYSGVTFTGCYDAIRKQTNVMRPTTNENVYVPPAVSDNGNKAAPSVIIATLSACINCMFIIACVWHFICRSKIKLCRDEYGMPRSNVSKTPDYVAIEPVPEIGTNGECGMTKVRGDENGVPGASKLENVIPREQGQRRVLNTNRGNEHLVTNASTFAKIPREQDQWQVLNTMRGNRYPVTNGSTLVVDNYERAKIKENDLVDYLESKRIDVKVQEDYCSTPTSETYSQISSADSKTSEDDLVLKERGRVHRKHHLNDMQLHCNLSHIH